LKIKGEDNIAAGFQHGGYKAGKYAGHNSRCREGTVHRRSPALFPGGRCPPYKNRRGPPEARHFLHHRGCCFEHCGSGFSREWNPPFPPGCCF